MSKTKLCDIPSRKHPLSFEKYSKLYDELDNAAMGFVLLGQAELAGEMEAVRSRLSQAWEVITTAERAGR